MNESKRWCKPAPAAGIRRPDAPEPDRPLEKLRGEIIRSVYTNETKDYSVVRVRTLDGKERTVVGAFGGAFEGQGIEVTGRWRNHKEHGRQFQAESFKFTLPASADGIRRFLSSKLIHGIGPKRAKMIVDHFGDKTLDVLDNHSARLMEIPGFGKKTVESVRSSWKEHAAKREVLLHFQSLGISLAYCNRILKRFGEDALRVVRKNPYALAEEVEGIGFLRADQIAAEMGVGKHDDFRLRAGVINTLRRLEDQGHVCFPRGEFLEKAAELLDVTAELAERGLNLAVEKGQVAVDIPPPRPPNAERRAMVYLKSLFLTERELATILAKLAAAPYHKGGEMGPKVLSRNVTFNQEQLAAVENARRHPLSVITGGPGVGKTTVVGEITRRARDAGLKIELAAPTGRAAKRLGESTGLNGKTIHRMLKWDPAACAFVYNRDRKLKTDLLVVDETSMLDIRLAAHLMRAVETGTTVVLVGDVDQLPPVGPGTTLEDIIRSGLCPVVHLRQVYRQDPDSRIIPNAHAVNMGRTPDIRPVPRDRLADFYWIDQEDPAKAAETIAKLVCERVPARFQLDPRADVQVLSPMNKGPCGALNLNRLIRARLNPGPRGDPAENNDGPWRPRPGDKVMQTRNNYEKKVFNGDIGRVESVDERAKAFHVRFDEGSVAYDFADAAELTLAHAITIHKSQGSEFPAVVAPLLMAHYVMLRRNLVYTAMTRAKKLLVMIGSRKALAMAARNATVEPRHSALLPRLLERLPPR